MNNQSTEILWDCWGVPHIYSDHERGLFYGFGWAQMKAHGDLILRLYGQARGRGAEYWEEEYLDEDRWVRTMGVPARAGMWYRQQGSGFRELLDSFSAGMNAYAANAPDSLDAEVHAVLPVSSEDVLAHTMCVINLCFAHQQSGL